MPVHRPSVIGTLSLTVVLCSATLGAGQTWETKVDPLLLETADAPVPAEVLVRLTEQADLGRAAFLTGKEAKGRFVFARLRSTAERSQEPLRRRLDELGVEYRPFWIANLIWVRGHRPLIEELARRPDVAHLHGNPRVGLDLPLPVKAGGAACPAGGVEPSLSAVGADRFWDRGLFGQGVVVAGQDTGVQWDHPALRDRYRGWDGVSADHSYNWHDAIHSGGGVCGADSLVPCDDFDHGTHTMGTMVGDNGADRFGLAPQASWIGCRNMDQGQGTPASYTECFQFFLAPTDLAGDHPDPSKAPDVINNSWSCADFEGCADPTILQTVVENVRAAGILVVAAATNGGPSCDTLADPPAIYDAAFTVGATDLAGGIASFSSRGPATSDGGYRIKPDLSAPGVDICSTVRGDGYLVGNGTSMSGPHVAGMAALLMSADASLRGDVDALEAYLLSTAIPRTTAEFCGGVSGFAVPNNTYGYGFLDGVVPTEIFTDGFETGDLQAWSAVVP